MRFGEVLSFRKDIFFDGAVQIDWFYNPVRTKTVAENFVFHGSEYFGVSDSGGKKLTDTVQFVHDIVMKVSDDQHVNPLSLAIAGYGTGKSHLAVTLADLLSGEDYQPDVHRTIIKNIAAIDGQKAALIAQATGRPNLVLVLNGMKDFNLNYELLRAAQRSLRLYGCSDDNLKKLNRAIETAFRFFERNASSLLGLFEEKARSFGYSQTGQELVDILRLQLGEEESAFDVINAVYNEINGNEIRWDEGVSATSVLETLLSEYCGISGPFNKIVLIFDEFGRYLEYASATTTARSGDSALQQIFECAQNAEGAIQVVNFIQSDIKSYLQRVDQTSNISRYIGRYDASDKYYLSSNLETVFANLIQRVDKDAFGRTIRPWQQGREALWNDIFKDMNRWLPTKGVWKDYSLFRQVVVEGIYPLHPLATYMLSQLSDYLQNRSSLMLLGRYVNEYENTELTPEAIPLVYPETLLSGDLFTEMLSAEEEGRQYSQHCIRYSNILRKYEDKLSDHSKMILRANLAMRILRCRIDSYEDVKHAISIFSGLDQGVIEEELVWLENEYAILGYDEHSYCFDFLEDSSGAHDFKTFFKRLRANTAFSYSVLEESKIREWADVLTPQTSNFAAKHKIKTNEWQYEQDLFSINELSEPFVQTCIEAWKAAITPDKLKGKLIWLYLNRDSASNALELACSLAKKVEGTPIVFMLLNDTEDRLNNALCDYLALQAVSEADRQKYGRHYIDKLEQTEENIKNAFDQLKKQRQRITGHGVQTLESRLAVALTDIFENVYPKVIPFDFDGFDSKQPGKARKAFCSIVRLLLSGSVNGDTIHSFPSEVRNRLEATLFHTGAFSWKVINANYQIIPPEQKNVRAVYEEIVDMLPEGNEIPLDRLIAKLVAPPYGLNDYVSVYLLFTLCANMSYCLRVVVNGAVYSIAAWRDEVIQDSKIDLGTIRKSTLKRVNAGAVADSFLRMFARIDNNVDIGQVDALSQELETLKRAENIPEALNAQYQLALNKIQEGRRIKKRWDGLKDEVNEKYGEFLDKRDVYSGLLAIQKLGGMSFYNCFSDSPYAMTEEQRNEITSQRQEIEQFVNPFLQGWILEQRCKGVESISQYRKHMERLKNLLQDVGYDTAAKQVKDRAEQELSNVENIRARQQLRSNCSDYLQNCVVKAVVPYTRLVEWKKQGEVLLGQIQKFSASLGSEAEGINKNISNRVAEVDKSIERIKKDMNDIYDDIYSVSSVEDISDMISRIQQVCQKGIPSTDIADFEELKSTLESFLTDIRALSDCQEDWEAFNIEHDELMRKYADNEYDFDVVSILEQVSAAIQDSLKKRDVDWSAKYLSKALNSRVDLLAWVDGTRMTPKYLSEETKAKFLERSKEVAERLSKAKIDDVIYSFIKLEEKEKELCFDRLIEIYQNHDTNEPNVIEATISRNKKWDLEEWVVLAKLYFENRGKTRTELADELSALSAMLVRRADILEIEHDGKYRNVNGLAMQLDRIKYIDTKGERGLSAYSELAEAAVSMYHVDREGFELIAKKCWEKYEK